MTPVAGAIGRRPPEITMATPETKRTIRPLLLLAMLAAFAFPAMGASCSCQTGTIAPSGAAELPAK